MKTQIEFGNLSDVGQVRKANEDYFGSYNGSFGNLIIVCDGMGGHKGGAMASRLAVNIIKEHFENLSANFNPKEELKNALIKANSALKNEALNNPELQGMGSTAVVLLVKEDQAYTAHVGDSRIYMVRGGKIHQLTKDHSLVQQMVDAGIITQEAAKDHPKKNVITRSLGAEGNNDPEAAEAFQIFKNDKFILCSDGLTGFVEDKEIKEIVEKNGMQQACRLLIDLANKRGGSDNITVQIVDVVKGKKLPIPNPLNDKKTRSILVYAFFFLTIGLFFYTTDFGIINGITSLFKDAPADSLKQSTKTRNNAAIKKDTLSISFQEEAINDTIIDKPKEEIKPVINPIKKIPVKAAAKPAPSKNKAVTTSKAVSKK